MSHANIALSLMSIVAFKMQGVQTCFGNKFKVFCIHIKCSTTPREDFVNSLGHSLINILRKLDLTNLNLKQVALKNELLCILEQKSLSRLIEH